MSEPRDAERTVGAAIRSLRKARGWTQTDLERESNVPQRTISRIEAATKEGYVPLAHTLNALATALGVSVGDLLAAAGYDIKGGAAEVDLSEPLISVSLAYGDRLSRERKDIVISLIRDLAEPDETEP